VRVALISVIVCTLQSSGDLRAALASLVAQDMAPDDYEVIVVANGPNPPAAVDLDLAGRTVRYVHEPRLGLSLARNAGLRAASGDVVAFMDDDAAADSRLLSSLLAAFECAPPGAACVGGKVVPEWERPPPAWLRGGLLRFLGLVDLGERRRTVRWPDEYLVGCNIAFRTEGLRAIGGFDAALGRRGHLLYGNEELAAEQRTLEAGGSLIYEPAAVVRHRIRVGRTTLSWFTRRVFFQGVTDYVYMRRYATGASGGGLASLLRQRMRSALGAQAGAATAFLALPYVAGLASGGLRSLAGQRGPGAPG
jgi:glycosyltransferase involved in cell wall biosynthesis